MSVRATRLRRLRVRKAVSRIAWSICLVAGGLLYLQMGKSVTLVVDGEAETVRTFDADVGELLELRGINLDPGALVLPSPSAPLADGMVVVVRTDPVLQDDDADDVGVWAVAGGNGELVQRLAGSEVALSAGTPVGLGRVHAATVVVRGKAHDVVTDATTVRQLLSAMGITPDGNDRVSPPLSTPLPVAEQIVFREMEFRVREVQRTIPFESETVTSDDLAPGEVRVVEAGAEGLVERTLQVWVVDGEVKRRWPVDERVIREPVARRIQVGPAPSGSHPGAGREGIQVGEASWYRPPWGGLTAAHPTLPFGTVVTVTNLDNGRTVTVTINDRGPFGGRVIDLSASAFEQIAPLSQGVARVRLTW